MKQTNASPKHSSLVYYLGTLAMLASMLLLPHLIPSWADGITPAGVSIACVFVGAIIGILTTNDLILCALFAMGGLVINGIQTPAQVISSFMGASYVWQIVVLYALCYVIIRDNTGEVIARFLLTRRFTQKYPMVMVMMLLFAFGLAAAFMGVFGALIVGFTLLDGIYAEAGIEPKSKLARLLCLGAFITMCIGPMTIGSMAALNLAAGQFFLAAAGVQVVTFRFVAEAFAILIAFCAVFALALRFLFRCDIRALGRVDLAQALADKPLPVYGEGLNVRDWLYVEDHCRAIDLIVRKGRVGEVYNVGGHNEMRNIDIVKLICKELGKPESLITHVTDRKGHDMRYAIDPAKIHNELGWLPETKFADVIKKTIRWYLDNREWWENIINGEYQNYYERMYGNR